MSELARMSRRRRSAVKLVDGLLSFSRCWMLSAPTDQPPTRPVMRDPASSGMASPAGDRPICRLKKKIMSCDAFWRPPPPPPPPPPVRSEEHTSELQSLAYLVCRLLLEKKKTTLLNAPPRLVKMAAPLTRERGHVLAKPA